MSNLGNKETMAKNLSFYLEKSGKTQKEMAEIVGVSASTFNEWLKGKFYPRIDKIEIMANFFGILKSDLIEEKSKEREEMQKNNDTLSDIILRLRRDAEFFSVVETLNNLDAERLQSIKSLLTPYSTTEK